MTKLRLISSNIDGFYSLTKDLVILDRYICTKEAPWNTTKAVFALHPNASYIRTRLYMCPNTDRVGFTCPNCGYHWEESWQMTDV